MMVIKIKISLLQVYAIRSRTGRQRLHNNRHISHLLRKLLLTRITTSRRRGTLNPATRCHTVIKRHRQDNVGGRMVMLNRHLLRRRLRNFKARRRTDIH